MTGPLCLDLPRIKMGPQAPLNVFYAGKVRFVALMRGPQATLRGENLSGSSGRNFYFKSV